MADTWAVFRAAYVIAALVYGGYALSIWMRAKRIREKLRERQ
jgi:type VI protein secretion system component VasF